MLSGTFERVLASPLLRPTLRGSIVQTVADDQRRSEPCDFAQRNRKFVLWRTDPDFRKS
jgi:hypothetical protein